MTFAFPNVATMNLVGCRMYRNTRLSSKRQMETVIPSYIISRPMAFQKASALRTDAITNGGSDLAEREARNSAIQRESMSMSS